MTATLELPRKLLRSALRTFRQRPLLVNLLLLFCAYMTFVYLPWDIFIKPVAEDQEVWFGYRFEGWLAKATALPHWLVYGAGTWGFWKMSRQVWFWAALYTAQVAFSMFVWPLIYRPGESMVPGIIGASVFLMLAVWLWRAGRHYMPLTAPAKEEEDADESPPDHPPGSASP